MAENAHEAAEARKESVLKMLDFDSVNVSEFAASLADYWRCDKRYAEMVC